MVNKFLTNAEACLHRMRYPLVVASLVMSTLLVFAQRAEAYCSLNTCSYSQHPSCVEFPCGHTSQTNFYFDPTCDWSNCCKQGQCYLDNDLLQGAGCGYCGSGDIAFCGYGAGC